MAEFINLFVHLLCLILSKTLRKQTAQGLRLCRQLCIVEFVPLNKTRITAFHFETRVGSLRAHIFSARISNVMSPFKPTCGRVLFESVRSITLWSAKGLINYLCNALLSFINLSIKLDFCRSDFCHIDN